MRLRTLRKLVNSIPEKMDGYKVVLQIDSEGNGYNDMAGLDTNAVRDKRGEVYFDQDEQWERYKDDPKRRIIILYPE